MQISGVFLGGRSEDHGRSKNFCTVSLWECANWESTLWLFNIAMENGPFTDSLPIKNGDFPWLC